MTMYVDPHLNNVEKWKVGDRVTYTISGTVTYAGKAGFFVNLDYPPVFGVKGDKVFISRRVLVRGVRK